MSDSTLSIIPINKAIKRWIENHVNTIKSIANELNLPPESIVAPLIQEAGTIIFDSDVNDYAVFRIQEPYTERIVDSVLDSMISLRTNRKITQDFHDRKDDIQAGTGISWLGKFWDSTENDIGWGNVNLGTAILMVNRYLDNPAYKNDPLHLAGYKDNYRQLALDIINPHSDASFAISGLMAKQGDEHFKTVYGSTYEAASDQVKSALLTTYFKQGAAKIAKHIPSGDGKLPDPWVGDGGPDIMDKNNWAIIERIIRPEPNKHASAEPVPGAEAVSLPGSHDAFTPHASSAMPDDQFVPPILPIESAIPSDFGQLDPGLSLSPIPKALLSAPSLAPPFAPDSQSFFNPQLFDDAGTSALRPPAVPTTGAGRLIDGIVGASSPGKLTSSPMRAQLPNVPNTPALPFFMPPITDPMRGHGAGQGTLPAIDLSAFQPLSALSDSASAEPWKSSNSLLSTPVAGGGLGLSADLAGPVGLDSSTGSPPADPAIDTGGRIAPIPQIPFPKALRMPPLDPAIARAAGFGEIDGDTMLGLTDKAPGGKLPFDLPTFANPASSDPPLPRHDFKRNLETGSLPVDLLPGHYNPGIDRTAPRLDLIPPPLDNAGAESGGGRGIGYDAPEPGSNRAPVSRGAAPRSSAAPASGQSNLQQHLQELQGGADPHDFHLNDRALGGAVKSAFERNPGGPNTGSSWFDTSQFATPAGTPTGGN
jgi:hypothetical protein